LALSFAKSLKNNGHQNKKARNVKNLDALSLLVKTVAQKHSSLATQLND